MRLVVRVSLFSQWRRGADAWRTVGGSESGAGARAIDTATAQPDERGIDPPHVLPYPSPDLDAAHARHLDVADDQILVVAPRMRAAVDAVVRLGHATAGTGENAGEEIE